MNKRYLSAQKLLIAAGLLLLVFNGSALGRETLAILRPLPNERFVTNETVNLTLIRLDWDLVKNIGSVDKVNFP